MHFPTTQHNTNLTDGRDESYIFSFMMHGGDNKAKHTDTNDRQIDIGLLYQLAGNGNLYHYFLFLFIQFSFLFFDNFQVHFFESQATLSLVCLATLSMCFMIVFFYIFIICCIVWNGRYVMTQLWFYIFIFLINNSMRRRLYSA